jgi:hypothetical protein
MVPALTDEIHDLDIGQACSLDGIAQCTIRSVKSRLWVTQEGMPDDIVLAPGDCVTIKTKGRVAMEALDGHARFAVSRKPGRERSLRSRLYALWARCFVRPQRLDCR